MTFGDKIEEPLSPAPYATTTLLPPRNGNQVRTKTRELQFSFRNYRTLMETLPPFSQDDDLPYASSCCYGHNCHSETYYFIDQNYAKINGKIFRSLGSVLGKFFHRVPFTGSARGVPSSVVLSQCGRKTVSEIGGVSNQSPPLPSNPPPTYTLWRQSRGNFANVSITLIAGPRITFDL